MLSLHRSLCILIPFVTFFASCTVSGCSSEGTSSSQGAGVDSRAASGTGGDTASGGAAGSSGIGGNAGDAGGPPVVDPGMGGDPPELTDEVTIHIAGDSTAAIFPETDATGRVGWAAVLGDFLGDGIVVNDAARSGRSSKSFYDEGHWGAIKAQIQQGDYVFIQFAHNDEKLGDAARYTDPETTFPGYLKVYIGETRQAGGFPVLLTPISRRQFSGTAISPTHGAYPAAMIALAEETGTPVIDMTERTRVWLEELGLADSLPMFAVSDGTHLSADGAVEVAALVVEGITELDLPIVERLAD